MNYISHLYLFEKDLFDLKTNFANDFVFFGKIFEKLSKKEYGKNLSDFLGKTIQNENISIFSDFSVTNESLKTFHKNILCHFIGKEDFQDFLGISKNTLQENFTNEGIDFQELLNRENEFFIDYYLSKCHYFGKSFDGKHQIEKYFYEVIKQFGYQNRNFQDLHITFNIHSRNNRINEIKHYFDKSLKEVEENTSFLSKKKLSFEINILDQGSFSSIKK